MSIVRSPVRFIVRSPVRGVLASSGGQTALQQVLALSPSLLLWRAENAGTVNRDGTGATATGTDLVGRIIDLSGNNNHASAPADTNRATLNATGWVFGGTDDYYTLASAISITESMTVVRAFKRASAGIDNIGLSTTGTQPYDPWWRAANDILIAMNAGTNSTQASGQTQTGSFVTSTRRNVTNERARLNGVDLTPAAAAAVAGTFNTFGRRSTTYNSGEISFLAVFPTELTGADLALVEQIAAATNGAVLA